MAFSKVISLAFIVGFVLCEIHAVHIKYTHSESIKTSNANNDNSKVVVEQQGNTAVENGGANKKYTFGYVPENNFYTSENSQVRGNAPLDQVTNSETYSQQYRYQSHYNGKYSSYDDGNRNHYAERVGKDGNQPQSSENNYHIRHAGDDSNNHGKYDAYHPGLDFLQRVNGHQDNDDKVGYYSENNGYTNGRVGNDGDNYGYNTYYSGQPGDHHGGRYQPNGYEKVLANKLANFDVNKYNHDELYNVAKKYLKEDSHGIKNYYVKNLLNAIDTNNNELLKDKSEVAQKVRAQLQGISEYLNNSIEMASNNVEKAVDLLHKVVTDQLEPTIKNYTQVLKECAKKHNHEKVPTETVEKLKYCLAETSNSAKHFVKRFLDELEQAPELAKHLASDVSHCLEKVDQSKTRSATTKAIYCVLSAVSYRGYDVTNLANKINYYGFSISNKLGELIPQAFRCYKSRSQEIVEDLHRLNNDVAKCAIDKIKRELGDYVHGYEKYNLHYDGEHDYPYRRHGNNFEKYRHNDGYNSRHNGENNRYYGNDFQEGDDYRYNPRHQGNNDEYYRRNGYVFQDGNEFNNHGRYNSRHGDNFVNSDNTYRYKPRYYGDNDDYYRGYGNAFQGRDETNNYGSNHRYNSHHGHDFTNNDNTYGYRPRHHGDNDDYYRGYGNAFEGRYETNNYGSNHRYNSRHGDDFTNSDNTYRYKPRHHGDNDDYYHGYGNTFQGGDDSNSYGNNHRYNSRHGDEFVNYGNNGYRYNTRNNGDNDRYYNKYTNGNEYGYYGNENGSGDFYNGHRGRPSYRPNGYQKILADKLEGFELNTNNLEEFYNVAKKYVKDCSKGVKSHYVKNLVHAEDLSKYDILENKSEVNHKINLHLGRIGNYLDKSIELASDQVEKAVGILQDVVINQLQSEIKNYTQVLYDCSKKHHYEKVPTETVDKLKYCLSESTSSAKALVKSFLNELEQAPELATNVSSEISHCLEKASHSKSRFRSTQAIYCVVAVVTDKGAEAISLSKEVTRDGFEISKELAKLVPQTYDCYNSKIKEVAEDLYRVNNDVAKCTVETIKKELAKP